MAQVCREISTSRHLHRCIESVMPPRNQCHPHMPRGKGISIYRTLVPWTLTKVLRQLPKSLPDTYPDERHGGSRHLLLRLRLRNCSCRPLKAVPVPHGPLRRRQWPADCRESFVNSAQRLGMAHRNCRSAFTPHTLSPALSTRLRRVRFSAARSAASPLSDQGRGRPDTALQ